MMMEFKKLYRYSLHAVYDMGLRRQFHVRRREAASAPTFLRAALIPSFHSERLHGGNCERYRGDIDHRIVPHVRRVCVSRQAKTPSYLRNFRVQVAKNSTLL